MIIITPLFTEDYKTSNLKKNNVFLSIISREMINIILILKTISYEGSISFNIVTFCINPQTDVSSRCHRVKYTLSELPSAVYFWSVRDHARLIIYIYVNVHVPYCFP
jgi:hypothetical protein